MVIMGRAAQGTVRRSGRESDGMRLGCREEEAQSR